MKNKHMSLKISSVSWSAQKSFHEVKLDKLAGRYLNYNDFDDWKCLDYVGFIKKIMKLLQKGYNEIQALEVELRILEQTSAPPSRPRKLLFWFILVLFQWRKKNVKQNLSFPLV